MKPQLKDFRGCGTAIVTPFDGGEVDYQAFARLVDLQVESGMNFLVPLGSTGETPCLEDDEKVRVLEKCREHACGKTLVAGVGTNSLRHTIRNRRPLTISLHRNMVFDVWIRLVIFS